ALARHGRRAAPAARHQHRRRAHAVADPHALHDAGHLPLSRALRAQEESGGDRESGRGGGVNISEPFIRRPIATSLVAAAIVLAGVIAFLVLPVAPLPRTDSPTLSVTATLPGANPETMASSVATPLERRFGRIAGLTEMTSTSGLGQTSITLQFDLDRDQDSCGRDVQAAINAANGDLPPGMPARPSYRKTNPA